VAAELEKDERIRLAERGLTNPEFFCTTFFPHLFPKEMPPVHRGLLAILTKKTRWLLESRDGKPPDLWWIVKNFVEKDEEAWRERQELVVKRQIFQVTDGERELDWQEIKAHEEAQGFLPHTWQVKLCLGRFTVVLLPRAFAKTTLAGVVVPIRKAVYHECDFFCYVSETASHSEMQVNNIRYELGGNHRLRSVFGEMRPDRSSDLKWSETFFETLSGVAMAARGRGAQIRGLLHHGRRPKEIICDDLEDKESVETEYQREKTRNWAYGDLIPALPSEDLDPEATITAVGTLLHSESLLAKLMKDPQWTGISMGALDVDGEPLWADGLSRESLAAKKESYILNAQLHIYYLEYFNEPRAEEDHPFKPHMIKQDSLKEGEHFVHSVTYCDPAISVEKRASECVTLGVGITNLGRIGIRAGWGDRGVTPRKLIDVFFQMVKVLGCRISGIESQQYQAALVHLVREEMFRKKQYFEVRPVPHNKAKNARVQGMILPRAQNGYIFYVQYLPKLHSQLMDFNPKKKEQPLDWPDALAGAIELLDDFAAQASGGDLSLSAYEEDDENFGRWAS
jgi:hypothetical protein